MLHPPLSPADSAAFRKLLVETYQTRCWTLKDVSKLLGCSRKTAWNHMQSDCRVGVRACYAERLAKVVPPEKVVWGRANQIKIGVRLLLDEWALAANPPRRRRLMYRLASYIAESAAASYDIKISKACIDTSFTGDPIRLAITLSMPSSTMTGTITLTPNSRYRQKIDAEFCDSNGQSNFSGELTDGLLPRLFVKIRSWQSPPSKKQRRAQDRS